VDIYSFFYLYRESLGGNNNYRATFMSDDVPENLESGKDYVFNVKVRNDGWEDWTGGGENPYALGFWFYKGEERPVGLKPVTGGGSFVSLDRTVKPGEEVTFKVGVKAPAEGDYLLVYDMLQDGVSWFEDKNNLAWEKAVKVKAVDSCAKNGKGDINCDGLINTADYDIWKTEFLDVLRGVIGTKRSDVNGDGIVNLIDFGIWRSNW